MYSKAVLVNFFFRFARKTADGKMYTAAREKPFQKMLNVFRKKPEKTVGGNGGVPTYHPFPTTQTWPQLVWLDQQRRPIPDAYLKYFYLAGTNHNLVEYRDLVQRPLQQQPNAKVHIPRSHEIRIRPTGTGTGAGVNNQDLNALESERRTLQLSLDQQKKQLVQQREQSAQARAQAEDQLRRTEAEFQKTQEEERKLQERYQEKLSVLEREERRQKRQAQAEQFSSSVCGTSKASGASCLLEIVNRHPDLVLCSQLGEKNGLPSALCAGNDDDKFRAYILDRTQQNQIVASVDKDGLIERYDTPIPIPEHLRTGAPASSNNNRGGGRRRTASTTSRTSSTTKPSRFEFPVVTPVTEEDQESLYDAVQNAPEVRAPGDRFSPARFSPSAARSRATTSDIDFLYTRDKPSNAPAIHPIQRASSSSSIEPLQRDIRESVVPSAPMEERERSQSEESMPALEDPDFEDEVPEEAPEEEVPEEKEEDAERDASFSASESRSRSGSSNYTGGNEHDQPRKAIRSSRPVTGGNIADNWFDSSRRRG